jgi:hypothetical protein
MERPILPVSDFVESECTKAFPSGSMGGFDFISFCVSGVTNGFVQIAVFLMAPALFAALKATCLPTYTVFKNSSPPL